MFGTERPKPSRPPTATDSGGPAGIGMGIQTAQRSESPTARSLRKDLISIEEEAEAAAQSSK